jgi:hypothetical protein
VSTPSGDFRNLGDPGSSAPFGSSSQYSITVAWHCPPSTPASPFRRLTLHPPPPVRKSPPANPPPPPRSPPLPINGPPQSTALSDNPPSPAIAQLSRKAEAEAPGVGGYSVETLTRVLLRWQPTFRNVPRSAVRAWTTMLSSSIQEVVRTGSLEVVAGLASAPGRAVHVGGASGVV